MAPTIGASWCNMKREHYGDFSVAYLATHRSPEKRTNHADGRPNSHLSVEVAAKGQRLPGVRYRQVRLP